MQNNLQEFAQAQTRLQVWGRNVPDASQGFSLDERLPVNLKLVADTTSFLPGFLFQDVHMLSSVSFRRQADYNLTQFTVDTKPLLTAVSYTSTSKQMAPV